MDRPDHDHLGIDGRSNGFRARTDKLRHHCAFFSAWRRRGSSPAWFSYFTYWFPKTYRSRVLSTLYLAVPVANAVTAAISGALLGLDGFLGIAGWQWLYIIEAAPAVLLGFVVLHYLTDRPEVADWLKPDEKTWLSSTIEAERQTLLTTQGRTYDAVARLHPICACCR